MSLSAELFPLAVQHLIFKGSADSPLLAPRGVWLAGNRLLVADTAQNRVFIWHTLPRQEYQEPDVVLGQAHKTDTGRNAGADAHASSLLYPSGIWSDGERLIVADAWNHRVLIWHSMPVHNGQPADVVLGQPGFLGNQPNVRGLGEAPTERSLYWCYGVYSDGQHLWIADTGNRRVLFYEDIPRENYAAASGVIGQENFTEKEYNSRQAIWPYSVKVSPGGVLAITDTQYYRVLLWAHHREAFSREASVVIGQPDLDSSGQNQYAFHPGARTLSWCYDSGFYQDGIWVADTGNSRLLWYSQIPGRSDTPANGLLGKPDFITGSENLDSVRGTENSLYWPFSLAISNRLMAVADTGNHRILLYHLHF